MENLPRKLEKTLKETAARPAPLKRRRTLLLVDETTGQTREVTWMRGLLKLMCFLLCGAVLSAVFFGYLYRLENEKYRRLLAERASASRQEPVEKAEAHSPETAAEGGEEEAVSSPEPPSAEAPAPETDTEQAREKEEPPEEEAETAAAPEPPGETEASESQPASSPESEPDPELPASLPRSRVSVDDFSFELSSGGEPLSIRFNIRNIDPENGPVSGHVILVLGAGSADPGKRIAVPDVPLFSGRPTGETKGESFSISRFKTVKLQTGERQAADKYQTATVFVFEDSGPLMLEQKIPLDFREE